MKSPGGLNVYSKLDDERNRELCMNLNRKLLIKLKRGSKFNIIIVFGVNKYMNTYRHFDDYLFPFFFSFGLFLLFL